MHMQPACQQLQQCQTSPMRLNARQNRKPVVSITCIVRHCCIDGPSARAHQRYKYMMQVVLRLSYFVLIMHRHPPVTHFNFIACKIPRRWLVITCIQSYTRSNSYLPAAEGTQSSTQPTGFSNHRLCPNKAYNCYDDHRWQSCYCNNLPRPTTWPGQCPNKPPCPWGHCPRYKPRSPSRIWKWQRHTSTIIHSHPTNKFGKHHKKQFDKMYC